MTRLQRTLLLAAIVGGAGIAGATYLATRRLPQHERLRLRVEEERLFGFGRLAVRSLSLTRDGRALRIERDPATEWAITEPFAWPADLQAVEAIMDRTAGLRRVRVAFDAPSDGELEDTGLANPRLRLDVELKDGSTHVLALGTKNPVTGLLHARADGGPVTLVDPEYQWTLDRPPTDLRMDRLFPYRTQDVQRIELRPPKSPRLRLEKVDGGHRVRTPEERFDAGVGEAAVLLAAVTKRLEAETYRGDAHPYPSLPTPDARFEPGSILVLTVHHVTGAVRSATIALATDDFTGDRKPIAWVGPTVVELYPPPVREIVETTADGLRDRTLAWFSPREATRIRVEYADGRGPWTFQREPPTATDPRPPWRRTTPSPAEGDPAVFKAVLMSLARLKGSRTVDEAPTRAELRDWGLEPASRRFVVEAEDGRTLADVRLGVWAGEDELYARGAPARVDAVSLDRVLRIPGERARLLTRPDAD